MATEKRMESMGSEEKGVAGERLYVEFPQKYAYIKEMTINGITYVNTLMTDVDAENLLTL